MGRNSTHHFVVLIYIHRALKIKCSRLREEGLPLRNEDIEAFSEEEEMDYGEESSDEDEWSKKKTQKRGAAAARAARKEEEEEESSDEDGEVVL